MPLEGFKKSPKVFRNPNIIIFWDSKEKNMKDIIKNLWVKFHSLDTGYKILVFIGFFLLLAVLLTIGVDPADDYSLIND